MADVAEWVLQLHADALPIEVRRQLLRAILDGLGAAIAGTGTRTARIAARFASRMGRTGPATVLASGERLEVAPAVLANVTAANALDIDDGYRPVKGHPGAFLITPAIAAVEACLERGGGELGPGDLLAAIAAGYEIATRAGVATHRTYHHYHASGSWGSLGTAACVGKLCGLDADCLRWAFGLAEYHAPLAPIERCLARPAMTKDGIAWGAFAGACAVQLAEEGFTGNPSLLDDTANADLTADLGRNWRLLDLYFKPYPCCRWAQPAVDGVLRLRQMHALLVEEVTRIVVHTFREAAQLQTTPPASTEEAQYNLAWPVAAALVYGDLGPQHVAEEGLQDQTMRRVTGLIQTRVEPGIQERFPGEALAWVEIRTRSGEWLRGELIPARGDPGTALTDEEIEHKFLRITRPVLGDDAGRLLGSIMRLEEPSGLESLIRTLHALPSGATYPHRKTHT